MAAESASVGQHAPKHDEIASTKALLGESMLNKSPSSESKAGFEFV